MRAAGLTSKLVVFPFRVSFILFVLLSLMAAPLTVAEAQQPPDTPPEATSDEEAAPDGSRLRASYETFETGIELLAPATARTASAVTPAVAERLRGRLPEGFSLGEGDTRGVMRQPSGGDAEERTSPAKFVTLFPLRYENIPLSKGSDYLAITGADGRLLTVRERSLPTEVDATQPTVVPNEAVAAAREHAAPALEASEVNRTRNDEPRLEIWVDRELTGTLTWTFSLRSSSQPPSVARRYWVKATGAPTVVSWESELYRQNRGSVIGTLWESTPVEATGDRPLADLRVRRVSDGARELTDEDGDFLFPDGERQAQFRAALRGIHCRVQDDRGNPLTRLATGSPSDPAELDFNAVGELQLAQTSAYYWCNFGHSLSRLDRDELRALTVRVNSVRPHLLGCNAAYDADEVALYFLGANDRCVNTAYSDVVLHEYGHAVDDLRGGIVDRGYSEGFGDVLANLGTRQPCIGRDMEGPGFCHRDATELVTWPPDTDQEHAVGRIYSGFVWHLVEQLEARMTEEEAFEAVAELILAVDAANPSGIPDAVDLAFLLDDEERPPETCELVVAASLRNLPRSVHPPGELEVRLKVRPEDDPGRFDVRIDGETVLEEARGSAIATQAVRRGEHHVVLIGGSGTSLSDYQTVFSGDCNLGGRVTVGSCQTRACTITVDAEETPQGCVAECFEEFDECDLDPRVCIQELQRCREGCDL